MEGSIITTIEEFDQTLREVALIDSKVTAAGVQRADDILVAEGRYKARTDVLLGRRELLAKHLESFYRANRSIMERKGKHSIELQFGCAGIKKAASSLKTVKGWTWEKVLTAIKGADIPFTRTKEEVDKQKLKAAKLDAAKLAEIGVRISQPETFWFETKPVPLSKEKVA